MKYLGALFFLFFICLTSIGQCFTNNTVFAPGERLTYQAFYNWHFIWINGGEVVFKVDNATYQQKPVFKLSTIGYTHKGYDKLYKVRDTFTAVVDTQFIEPIVTQRKTNEGSYVAFETYRFDKAKKVIHSSIKIEDEPVKNTSVVMKDCTSDVLTMVYKARNIDFSKYKVNDKIPIRMIVDGVIHDLHITYLGKEIITTRDQNRKFRCIKFKPLLMKGTLFEAGEDMIVWVTDDRNRVPVMVEAKIMIGSVKAVLSDTKGLRYPLSAEIK